MPRDWLTEWYNSGDTGTSSETIARVLTGERIGRPDAPYDGADVGRCVRLLDLAAKNGQDWRARLGEVADRYPAWWAPLVSRWPDIEAAYAEDIEAQRPERYDRRNRRQPCPPSRSWHLVSVLRGRGDPYRGEAVPWPREPDPQ